MGLLPQRPERCVSTNFTTPADGLFKYLDKLYLGVTNERLAEFVIYVRRV